MIELVQGKGLMVVLGKGFELFERVAPPGFIIILLLVFTAFSILFVLIYDASGLTNFFVGRRAG